MAVASSSTSSSSALARFCRRALLFGVVQAAIFVALTAAFHRSYAQSYLASTCDKHARARAAERPRLFFVGGSSVAFGVDCERVRERTSYEPVNLAVHAGVGMDFMLSEALSEIKPGDVAVVSLEYAHLVGYMPEGKDLRALVHVLLHRPQNALYLSPRFLPRVLDNGFWAGRIVLRSAVEELRGHPPTFEAPYRRDSLNAYGDVVAHRAMPSIALDTTEVSLRTLPENRVRAAIARLNRFDAACQARGVFVCYVHPPIPRVCQEPVADALARVDQLLRQGLHMPVLNHPADVSWPLEQFYDTCYHLNGAAALRRTDLLLDSLVEQRASWAADTGTPPAFDVR